MEEKVCYDVNWNTRRVSLKDMVKGRVYFVYGNGSKEDKVMMYLGRVSSGRHMFYQFASAFMVPSGSGIITYGNYGPQVEGIRHNIRLAMGMRAQAECVKGYLKNPGIAGEFPLYPEQGRPHYEQEYLDWYNNSFADGSGPLLASGKVKTDFVKASELVPGCLYYTARNSYPIVFAYMGRRSNGNFIWVRIYSPDWYERHKDGIKSLYAMSDITVSNRRCKAVETAEGDDGLDERMKAAIMQYSGLKIDLTYVDQAFIDGNTSEGYR